MKDLYADPPIESPSSPNRPSRSQTRDPHQKRGSPNGIFIVTYGPAANSKASPEITSEGKEGGGGTYASRERERARKMSEREADGFGEGSVRNPSLRGIGSDSGMTGEGWDNGGTSSLTSSGSQTVRASRTPSTEMSGRGGLEGSTSGTGFPMPTKSRSELPLFEAGVSRSPVDSTPTLGKASRSQATDTLRRPSFDAVQQLSNLSANDECISPMATPKAEIQGMNFRPLTSTDPSSKNWREYSMTSPPPARAGGAADLGAGGDRGGAFHASSESVSGGAVPGSTLTSFSSAPGSERRPSGSALMGDLRSLSTPTDSHRTRPNLNRQTNTRSSLRHINNAISVNEPSFESGFASPSSVGMSRRASLSPSNHFQSDPFPDNLSAFDTVGGYPGGKATSSYGDSRPLSPASSSQGIRDWTDLSPGDRKKVKKEWSEFIRNYALGKFHPDVPPPVPMAVRLSSSSFSAPLSRTSGTGSPMVSMAATMPNGPSQKQLDDALGSYGSPYNETSSHPVSDPIQIPGTVGGVSFEATSANSYAEDRTHDDGGTDEGEEEDGEEEEDEELAFFQENGYLRPPRPPIDAEEKRLKALNRYGFGVGPGTSAASMPMSAGDSSWSSSRSATGHFATPSSSKRDQDGRKLASRRVSFSSGARPGKPDIMAGRGEEGKAWQMSRASTLTQHTGASSGFMSTQPSTAASTMMRDMSDSQASLSTSISLMTSLSHSHAMSASHSEGSMTSTFSNSSTEIIDGEESPEEMMLRYGLHDGKRKEAIDRICKIAKGWFGVERVMISLVHEDRQVIASQVNFPVPSGSQLQYDSGFCPHAILQEKDEPFVVYDASEDWRFAGNPWVRDQGMIQFYASHAIRLPVTSSPGSASDDTPQPEPLDSRFPPQNSPPVGSICLIDDRPRIKRSFTEEDKAVLKDLAAMVAREFEMAWEHKRREREHDMGKAVVDLLRTGLGDGAPTAIQPRRPSLDRGGEGAGFKSPIIASPQRQSKPFQSAHGISQSHPHGVISQASQMSPVEERDPENEECLRSPDLSDAQTPTITRLATEAASTSGHHPETTSGERLPAADDNASARGDAETGASSRRVSVEKPDSSEPSNPIFNIAALQMRTMMSADSAVLLDLRTFHAANSQSACSPATRAIAQDNLGHYDSGSSAGTSRRGSAESDCVASSGTMSRSHSRTSSVTCVGWLEGVRQGSVVAGLPNLPGTRDRAAGGRLTVLGKACDDEEWLATLTQKEAMAAVGSVIGSYFQTGQSSFGPLHPSSPLGLLVPEGTTSTIALPVFDYDNQPTLLALVTTSAPYASFESADLVFARAAANICLAVMLKDRVIEADRAKLAFVSQVSHELRSPLHGLLAQLELIRDSLHPSVLEQILPLLDTAEVCGQSLRDVLDDVLDYGKLASTVGMEESTAKRPLSSINLETVIEDICKSTWVKKRRQDGVSQEVHPRDPATVKPKQTNVDVILEIEDRVNGWDATADAGGLKRVLLNLVGNSLKFTETGYIKIRLRELFTYSPDAEQTVVEFLVEDTGRGMSEEFMKDGKLFMPFKQENPFSQGAGLGMSICAGIVRRMNGTIQVTSELGAGTTIRVAVPIHLESLGHPDTFARTVTFRRRTISDDLDKLFGNVVPLVLPPLNLPTPPSDPLPPSAVSESMTVSVSADSVGTDSTTSTPGTSPSISPPLKTATAQKFLGEDAEQPASDVTVLVAEDNPISRNILTRLLTKKKLPFRQVDDGVKAVAAFKEFHPTHVWIDVQMPEMDGVEASAAMRLYERAEGLAPAKIIALTGLSSEADMKKGILEGGIDEWIVKGGHLKNLLDTLSPRVQRTSDNLTDPPSKT